MGGVKNWLLEQEDSLYSSQSGFVCAGCVTDVHLQEALRAQSRPDAECSYCGDKNATELDVLLEKIQEAILHDYDDPAAELLYDGAEDGYQGEVLTGPAAVDLLDDWTNHDKLQQDVAQAFYAADLCRRDYYGVTEFEALKWGWERFAEQIKHRARFLFLRELETEDDHDPRTIVPGRMLDALGALFRKLNLFCDLAPSMSLYRARVTDIGERPATASELGTAPRGFARQPNRMSPAGIPMFYAGLNEETAVLETYDNQAEKTAREITIARFHCTRPLRVLDLTRLPVLPSTFGPNRDKREGIAFALAFERDFTRPVARDERVHIEYVPTQVVTEYVRHHLRDAADSPLDGVLYNSSRDRAQRAVVLFAENDQCVDRSKRNAFDPRQLLELVDVRHTTPQEFASLWSTSSTD